MLVRIASCNASGQAITGIGLEFTERHAVKIIPVTVEIVTGIILYQNRFIYKGKIPIALDKMKLPRHKSRGSLSFSVLHYCCCAATGSSHVYSPGEIAPEGQTSAQVPQSTQILGSIEYFSPSEIAPEGHSSMHVPQAMQSSPITYAIFLEN